MRGFAKLARPLHGMGRPAGWSGGRKQEGPAMTLYQNLKAGLISTLAAFVVATMFIAAAAGPAVTATIA